MTRATGLKTRFESRISVDINILLLVIFASQGFLIRTASQKSGADQKPLASEDAF